MDRFAPLDNPLHRFGQLQNDYMATGEEAVLAEVADLGRLMAVTEFAIETVPEVHGAILATAIDNASREDSSRLVAAAATVLSELFVAYRFAPQAVALDPGPLERLEDPPTRFARFRPGGAIDSEPPVDLYAWLESQAGEVVSGEVHAAVSQRRIAMFESKYTEGGGHIRLTVCPFHDGGGIIGIREIERLFDARERAFQRRKLESVGQLASRMAHELNNLLQPIVSMAQMTAEDHAADAELAEAFGIILDNANRAAEIVGGMLLYVRRAPKDSRQIWLAETVASHVSALRPTLPPDVGLDLRISTTPMRVAVDHGELGQIIRNLTDNAIHAMAGHGQLTITLDDLPAGDSELAGVTAGRYVRLALSDNGPGISPAVLEHIFEPFFTTKEIGQGTGLGLSIVQGIVRSWGGGIAARNLPAGGVEFAILLPIEDSPRATVQDAQPVALNKLRAMPGAGLPGQLAGSPA